MTLMIGELFMLNALDKILGSYCIGVDHDIIDVVRGEKRSIVHCSFQSFAACGYCPIKFTFAWREVALGKVGSNFNSYVKSRLI